MKKFEFRLEKVLAYRRLAEQWAKDEYLARRAERLNVEAEIMALIRLRTEMLYERTHGLEDRIYLQMKLQRLDEQEREMRITLQVVENDEESAREVWQEKRQEAEVLEKLREHEVAEFKLELTRAEQAELDEWTAMRRSA